MKLKEYIKLLEKLPMNAEVYYAADEEGNSYHKLHMTPDVYERRELEIPGKGQVVVIN